jgi:hypothetical protein
MPNPKPEAPDPPAPSKARLCYPDGRVVAYDDPHLAYAVWLALPRGVRCAFRSAGDRTPVYPHDHVDRR